MSPAAATRVSAPFTTCHPDGSESILKPRQPAVVLPSNRSRQPAARSADVSVLGAWAERAGAIAGSRTNTAAAASAAERATVIVTSGLRGASRRATTPWPQHTIRHESRRGTEGAPQRHAHRRARADVLGPDGGLQSAVLRHGVTAAHQHRAARGHG